MMEEIEVVLKRIESVYRDDSYNYAVIDNFCVSRYHSEEPNTNVDSRVTFYK